MNSGTTATAVSAARFGELPDGTGVDRWRLEDGVVGVCVLTYGGILAEITAPDRHGRTADVCLGFDSLAGYLGDQPYLGALIGRYANRIALARFPLNGRTYQLAANHGRHHLHGGPDGFDTRVWAAEEIADGVRLRLTSPDGDQGYPGGLDVTVDYTLSGGVLRVDYTAASTEPDGGLDTVVNLTNHTYFQLAGHAAGPVGEHLIEVPASRFVCADADLIPTGDFGEVAGTPMDLRAPRRFADGWDADFAQVSNAGGYDHSWLLDGAEPGRLRAAARITDPGSGRVLEVATDQPAVHVYSGNFMTELPGAKDGATYRWRSGFCVETQHLPDSPNQPHFPTTVVRPGGTFCTSTAFRFTTS